MATAGADWLPGSQYEAHRDGKEMTVSDSQENSRPASRYTPTTPAPGGEVANAAPTPNSETPDHFAAAEPPSEQPQDQLPPYSSFTQWQKRGIVLGAALAAFFSPLTAQIYLPALNVLADEFHVTDAQINLTVTTYMIFQGLVPMFVGSFADSAGRRPAYAICLVVYIAANVGLALSRNYASLLAVRCLQSAGSSSTVALCSAVVADVVTSAERGQYIGFTAVPIVLAPSLGPVLGGVLAQYLGWRAIFWFLAILALVMLLAMAFFFPETCRRVVGDGSVRPHPFYRTAAQLIREELAAARRRRRQARRSRTGGQGGKERTETGTGTGTGTGMGTEEEDGLQRSTTATSAASRPTLRIRLPNPFASLVLLFEKELGLLLTFSSVVFAGFYAVGTAMPSQLAPAYGLSDLQTGLMYLPLAGGSICAAAAAGALVNRNYRRHAARLGLAVDGARQPDLSRFPIERARLEVGLPLLVLAAAAVASWGWALQARAHLALPCLLLFLMGLGLVGFSNTTNALLVDIYPARAGAATAANNLTRCLVGAGASAVILPMIKGMGVGWAFTLVGALYVVFSPSMWFVMHYGIQWRAELREKEERKRLKKGSGQTVTMSR